MEDKVYYKHTGYEYEKPNLSAVMNKNPSFL